jgi:7-carboxy-7-deazaguanine synthase
LKNRDEVKFVIGTVEDYEWMKRIIEGHELARRCSLLISWVTPILSQQRDSTLKLVPEGQTPLSRRELAERLVADAVPARFQLQMHKFIWPLEERGV